MVGMGVGEVSGDGEGLDAFGLDRGEGGLDGFATGVVGHRDGSASVGEADQSIAGSQIESRKVARVPGQGVGEWMVVPNLLPGASAGFSKYAAGG